jgi:ATP-dependent DNA ligase
MPLPSGFVSPCLPTKAPLPPSADGWLHQIKHDGFRVVARKDVDRVRLDAARQHRGVSQYS